VTVFLIFLSVILSCLCLALLVWVGFRGRPKAPSVSQVQEELEKRFLSLRSDLTQEIFNQGRLLSQEMNNLNQHLDLTLSDTRRSVQSDLKYSTELMADIHGKLGELGEASKRIHEVGTNISGLQELLRAPKLRGGIGEYLLEDLLSQILPRNFYEFQFSFRQGQIVDAVIRLGGQFVCIDSKFPLEAFRQLNATNDPEQKRLLRKEAIRVVKKHIGDISDKYIVPAEGTYDFALMYIPAESVYYEAVVRDTIGEESDCRILEYAIDKKVIPVSPNCIYAYLQVILIGLKGFQIESETKQILARMQSLVGQFEKFEKYFGILGRHLGNADGTFDKARRQLERFGHEIRSIDSIQDSPSKIVNETKTLLEDADVFKSEKSL